MGANFLHGPGKPFGEKMSARYNHVEFNQGIGAEMIAERWGIDRPTIDQFSLESHRKAVAARDAGHFDGEIVPITVKTAEGETVTLTADEGPRADTNLEKLAGLKTPFKADGVISAGSASQISDGAAALLLMERGLAEKLGLKPKARFVTFAMAGDDPEIMLTAPIPATKKALEKSGLTLDQIDHVEINEAFAPVVIAWQKELGADAAKVNPLGGAIALGHPLGASGARLMTTLVHALERTGGRYGLQTMCEGGGMANATIIERLA
jgi:acetyl-CoA acetyltransferase family protein